MLISQIDEEEELKTYQLKVWYEKEFKKYSTSQAKKPYPKCNKKCLNVEAHLKTCIVHKCDICDQVFKNKGMLQLHKSKKHEVKHVCEHCGESFNHKSLQKHLLRYHPESSDKTKVAEFRCKSCLKVFKTISLLENHLKLHHSPVEKMFKIIVPAAADGINVRRDKRKFCSECKMDKYHLPVHLRHVHGKEGSKAEVNRGDHSKNLAVVAIGSGILRVSRYPHTPEDGTLYSPCLVCYQWMRSTEISSHSKSCYSESSESASSSNLLTDLDTLENNIGAKSQIIVQAADRGKQDKKKCCSECKMDKYHLRDHLRNVHGKLGSKAEINWGDHMKNMLVIKKGSGVLRVARSPLVQEDGSLYTHCPVCFMWMKIHEFKKHSISCSLETFTPSGKQRRLVPFSASSEQDNQRSMVPSSGSSEQDNQGSMVPSSGSQDEHRTNNVLSGNVYKADDQMNERVHSTNDFEADKHRSFISSADPSERDEQKCENVSSVDVSKKNMQNRRKETDDVPLSKNVPSSKKRKKTEKINPSTKRRKEKEKWDLKSSRF